MSAARAHIQHAAATDQRWFQNVEIVCSYYCYLHAAPFFFKTILQ